MSFINAAAPDLDGSLDWAENQKEEVDQELIQQLCNRAGTETAAMDAFAKELLSGITHFVVSHFADEASDPYQIAHSEDVQNVHELDSATLKMA